MKTFFTKIMLVIASSLCMFEGLVLTAVGLGKLSPDRLVSIYNRVLAIPKALPTILGVGLFFVVIGFILLAVASHTRPMPRMIRVEKDGKELDIPQETIKDFIKQIIGQDPYISNATVIFERMKSGINIKIIAGLTGVSSVHYELDRVETTLRSELENVFEWRDFDFHFELHGVKVDPKKKYFVQEKTSKPATAGTKPEPEPGQVMESAGTVSVDENELTAEEEDNSVSGEDQELLEEQEAGAPQAREKKRTKPNSKGNARHKEPVKAKDSSLLSKLLWGK